MEGLLADSNKRSFNFKKSDPSSLGSSMIRPPWGQGQVWVFPKPNFYFLFLFLIICGTRPIVCYILIQDLSSLQIITDQLK